MAFQRLENTISLVIFLTVCNFTSALQMSDFTFEGQQSPKVPSGAKSASIADDPLRRVKRKTQHKQPWEINKNVCPPVLCPPLLTTAGVAREPTSNGSPFFEGDIVLDEELKSRLGRRKPRSTSHGDSGSDSSKETSNPPRSRSRRGIVRPTTRLWKYGIVPFTVDSSFSSGMKKYIEEAQKTIERKSCIRFKPKSSRDRDYVTYINQPGCWSYVGRTGGRQLVSLGSGCDHLGTVLHETAHALGFWHEQARPDRDKYVRIIKKNISPSGLAQFGKRDENETTSRGYAYDYKSIMHYGDRYFSINSKKTIKVIGIGRKLKLRVGQRRGLSQGDLAQLRAMYYCNIRAAKKRGCGADWWENSGRCYHFVATEKRNFAGSQIACHRLGATLLDLTSAKEDTTIKDHLIRFYPKTTRWRTGGQRQTTRSQKFVWSRTGNSDTRTTAPLPAPKAKVTGPRMKFTNWTRNHPGKHPSLVLARFDGSRSRFVWRGDGNTAKYNYICEKKSKKKCFKAKKKNGQDYRGKIDYTIGGVTCQKWSSQYPHRHKYYPSGNTRRDNANGLGNHAYCRNPNGKRRQPWCYVPMIKVKWQYCDIQICKK